MTRVDAAVLIPIKAFRHAKARLSPALTAAQRMQLARWTADRVIAASAPLPAFVACDDDEVAQWSTDRGATVLWQAGKGLNAAVDAAVAQLAQRGWAHVVVAHADLPVPDHLHEVARIGTISLVPDRRDDGTNVMSFPTGSPVPAAYGAGSFRRHLAAALALAPAVAVEVRRDVLLALDIDTPVDLLHPLVAPLVMEVLPGWLPTNPVNPRSVT
jgi:2-phospho-L-lactate guanylyltransferase